MFLVNEIQEKNIGFYSIAVQFLDQIHYYLYSLCVSDWITEITIITRVPSVSSAPFLNI